MAFNAFSLPTRATWSLLRAFPWLPIPAIVGEAAQHAVEVHFGMYVRGDGIAPGTETTTRMYFAAIKVVGFLLTILLTRRALRQGVVDASTPGSFEKGGVLVMILLPIALHYGINFYAVGRPPATVVELVAVDIFVIEGLRWHSPRVCVDPCPIAIRPANS